MALVRVYCGLAAAEMAPWLAAAIVDDAGRLLDVRHVSDDPAGYGYLSALLAHHTTMPALFAADRPNYLVGQLVAALNRPLGTPDEATIGELAERFCDLSAPTEANGSIPQRRAVGLARGLQVGVLHATTPRLYFDAEPLRPILTAHSAMTSGRQAAAAALREVLRVLYPAALTAYPDPSEPIPLRILELLPEPGLLAPSSESQARIAAILTDLAAAGLADANIGQAAVGALRSAAAQAPPRVAAHVVAEAVRQAVVCVRSCDLATATLLNALTAALAHTPIRSAHAAIAAAAIAAPPIAAPPIAAPPIAAAPGQAPEQLSRPSLPAKAPAPPSAKLPAHVPAQRQAATHRQTEPSQDLATTLAFRLDPLNAPVIPGGEAEPRPLLAGEQPLPPAEAPSAWFTDPNLAPEAIWASDEGWLAAGRSQTPKAGPETAAGLPRRVPQSNLVPGSAIERRTVRIDRDPRSVAIHAAGYLRGWRHGEEDQTGGYAQAGYPSAGYR